MGEGHIRYESEVYSACVDTCGTYRLARGRVWYGRMGCVGPKVWHEGEECLAHSFMSSG